MIQNTIEPSINRESVIKIQLVAASTQPKTKARNTTKNTTCYSIMMLLQKMVPSKCVKRTLE
jgi:hypothetical protein